MNRKHNGLHATSYVRLVDVETHVVDGLLDRLRDAEVAAYANPATGHRGPYGETILPGTPSDSVYVDSAQAVIAQGLVDGYLADVREELAWAGIVADFDAPTTDELRRWPASEDLDEPDDPGTRPGRVLRPADPSATGLPPGNTLGPTLGFDALRDAAEGQRRTGRRRDDATREPEADVEDHFVPPPPPPVPLPDTIGRFAWFAVIVGPLFLLLATFAGLSLTGWPGFVGVGAFMGGFVTLVARMKDRPPSDSGDDGAVV